MSNLWDLSNIQPQRESVLDGDTIPAMFWNAVKQRGPTTWMRQKQLGIWRSWTQGQIHLHTTVQANACGANTNPPP